MAKGYRQTGCVNNRRVGYARRRHPSEEESWQAPVGEIEADPERLQVARPARGLLPGAATDDERYYVPLTDTVGTRPLLIQPSQNRWCDVLRATGAGLVNRHYHPHQVFSYTISGRWGYLEHDWVATAGDFVFEAPGEAHTLVAHESDEPMLVHFNVTGPLVWLDENGEPKGTFDVYDYIDLCTEHYEKVGLGAGYVESLFR